MYIKEADMIAVRIPEDLEARLDKLAKRTGRTKTFYVREAITEHLDDLEDLYLAEKEVAKINAGAKAYSLDEVRKELGLED
jgi:RHH-type transcriptional regulator, rel operon repressor / antitoxin RelB